MLLADLVVCTDEVTATSSRTAKMKLRPELVVEIAVDGVQRSSRFPGGVALRFARVVHCRSDKPAAEADTIAAVRSFLPGAAGSIVSEP